MNKYRRTKQFEGCMNALKYTVANVCTVLPALTFINSEFCPYRVLIYGFHMNLRVIRDYSLNIIKQLMCVMETRYVFL
jgi:hypothetical protein